MAYCLEKKWLHKQYYVLGLSTYAIAKKVGCNPSTIRRNLLKHDIPLRDYVQANTGARNPFFGKKHTAASKKKISMNHADVSGANHPCWGKSNPAASERFKGSNNPRWKGGTSKLNQLIRGSTTYKTWRTKIFQRDHYTCQKCMKIGGNLNAHHVQEFAQLLVEEKITTVDEAQACLKLWDLDIGITLCVECHKKAHD